MAFSGDTLAWKEGGADLDLGERYIDRAFDMLSRTSDPWPSLWLPASVGCDDEGAIIHTAENPLEVERALGRPLSWTMTLFGGEKPWGAFQIRRPRHGEARGLPIPKASSLFLIRSESLFDGSKRKALVGWTGNRWAFAKQDEDLYWMAPHVCLAPGAQMAERYQWRAKFLHGAGHLMIFADARGALDLFRSRDAAPGERRKALLHWVRGHRRKTTEGESVTDVKRHLRGVHSFVWNGLQVRLEESEFERDQIAAAAPR